MDMSEKKVSAQGAGTASHQVAAALRAAIESGEYQPGDRLPSERVLASDHGVARNTAREAVRQLAVLTGDVDQS